MRVQLRKILHRLRDESGQSLIVVVSSMTVLLAMAGFGIDTATWMVRHHHDQVVADAAALAAANCLAHPGEAGSSITINGTVTAMPSCSSDTDTANATTVAIDYAAANGLTITSSQVTFANDQVTVNASNGSQSVFAQLFGIDKTTQRATSVAGWNSKPTPCTTAGPSCDFMFANSSNCNSGSSLTVSNQGSSAINGNIQTNGNLVASQTGNGGGINGSGTYGPGCTSTNAGNHNPWNTSPPAQLSQTISWPIDYSKDFPACYPQNSASVAGESECNANGYPSYCTNTGANIVLDPSIPTDAPQAGQIYCASGTGPNVHTYDPSTWTGNISINVGGNGNNNVYEDSFVAGTITYTGSGNSTFYACGWTASVFSSSGCQAPGPTASNNWPIFYAVDQDPSTACATATVLTAGSECALSMTGTGGLTLYGDMFVQNGTAWLNVHGNQAASDTCIEANTIEATLDGNFNGDGPALVTGGGGPIAGGDTLLQ